MLVFMRLLASVSLLMAVLLAACTPSFVDPPLTSAALAGDFRKVEELLSAGEDPNQHTRPGWGRALVAAASRPKNAAVIRRLVAGGADPNLLGNEGCLGCCRAVPLSVAVDADNIAALLATGASLHPAAPACVVSPVGSADRIRALLEAGVSPDAGNGVPPIFMASGPSLHLLSAAGAKVSAFDSDGNSAITHAASWSSAERLRWLRGAGVALTTNRFGQNSLHMAFRHRTSPPDPDVVSLLLSWGVEVNARDLRGRTPLAYGQELSVLQAKGVLHSFVLSFLAAEGTAKEREWENSTAAVLAIMGRAGATL
jgi:hypothetical protein